MLKVKRLLIKDFTVFEDINLPLANGINVFIGANDTGKTHILKLLYSVLWALRRTDEPLQRVLGGKLVRVFRPRDNKLGRLVRRWGRGEGTKGPVEVRLEFNGGKWAEFSFGVRAIKEVGELENSGIEPDELGEAIYIPPKELLSAWSFPEVYRKYEAGLGFEEIYYDSVELARMPVKAGAKSKKLKELMDALGRLIEGRVSFDKGIFYWEKERARLEYTLVAEGFKKLGGLWRLLHNGQLTEASYLFWDEPASNLNPKLMGSLAKFIVELASVGVQVFLSTHTYLLLGWLSVLLEERKLSGEKVEARFLRFYKDEEGRVRVDGPVSRYEDLAEHDEILEAYEKLLEKMHEVRRKAKGKD